MPHKQLSLPVERRTWPRLGVALLLATILLLASGLGLASAQDGFRLLRLTKSSDPTTRFSESASINYLGTRIAFFSDSDFLNQGNIENNQYEIWLYNANTLTVTGIHHSHHLQPSQPGSEHQRQRHQNRL